MKNPASGNAPGLPNLNLLDAADLLFDVECCIRIIELAFRHKGPGQDRDGAAIHYAASHAINTLEQARDLLPVRGGVR